LDYFIPFLKLDMVKIVKSKNFTKRNYLFVLFISLYVMFEMTGLAHSREWYVRPESGTYGKSNGSSYDSAWKGFGNVIWGEHGIQPGETLYICGTHIYTLKIRDGWLVTKADINVTSGSGENKRITIRGDYPGDPGTVWGAYIIDTEPWEDEGGGVWSITLPGDSYAHWYFELGAGGTYKELTKQNSIDMVRSNPGSHYSPDYGHNSRLYIQCSDSGSPEGRILCNRFGYDFKLGDNRYITFSHLKLLNPTRIEPAARPSFITWDGCTLLYGEHSLLGFWGKTEGMKVINCELGWAANGIYTISNTDDATCNYKFKGNYIHDMGVHPVTQNGDAHSIGIQGGENGIIEDNFIENCGTGPLLYAFTDQKLKNTVVRRNFIRNLHILGRASGYGVSTQCMNDSLSDKSGNSFYQNIVADSPVGYRFQFQQEQKVYNNIASNCDVGVASTRGYKGTGANVLFVNNIVYKSKKYHVKWVGHSERFRINFDRNLYYPNDRKMFFIKLQPFETKAPLINRELTQEEWRFLDFPSCMFDGHSVFKDPRLTRQVKLKNNISVYAPAYNSPAVNAGMNVGLTEDIAGAPIGRETDIGPFETSPQ
jgi:hypothetical protein